MMRQQTERQRACHCHRLRTAAASALLFVASLMPAAPHAEEMMTLKMESPAFAAGGEIPAVYTCEGQDISPPLDWEGIPEGTRSLVLIVDDPDAPDPRAPKMTWVHWVLYNIPAQASGLPEGAGELPAGTEEGMNDWRRTGYGGPCPPVGRHRYFHKLYALDVKLSGLGSNAGKAEVEAAMVGHVIEQAELVGTYEKSR